MLLLDKEKRPREVGFLVIACIWILIITCLNMLMEELSAPVWCFSAVLIGTCVNVCSRKKECSSGVDKNLVLCPHATGHLAGKHRFTLFDGMHRIIGSTQQAAHARSHCSLTLVLRKAAVSLVSAV